MRDSRVVLSYRSIQPEDTPQCARLVNETFGVAVPEEELRWSYFENPHGPTLGAVALDGEKVVGLSNLMPHRIQVGRRRGLILEGTDIVVHPEYRKRGVIVIRELNRYVMEHSQPRGDVYLWYGIPNERFFRAAKRFLNFKTLMRIPQLTLLLNPLAPLQRRKEHVMWSYRAAGALRSPLACAVTASFASRGNVSVAPLSRFDADCDDLWNRVRGEFDIVLERTSEFMNWRFMHWSGRNYRALSARRNGKLVGYAVLGFRREGAVLKGYIADFLTSPKDKRAVRSLIQEAIRSFARQGVDMVNCWAQPGSPFYSAWRRAGFIPTSPARHFIIRNEGLAAFPDEAHRVYEPQRWYLTLGAHEIY